MRLRYIAGSLLLSTICLLADDDRHDSQELKNVVYVHTNNPVPGQNAVLAYTRDPNTGILKQIAGSPFLTGGTGYLNSPERLGPDDTDQQLRVTDDHRFLYVVNEGSNTIAGFEIQENGSLRAVRGSPFPSGGIRPVSIGIHDHLMIAVNQGDQLPGGAGGTYPPTYASYLIAGEGTLIGLPWSQPAQAP